MRCCLCKFQVQVFNEDSVALCTEFELECERLFLDLCTGLCMHELFGGTLNNCYPKIFVGTSRIDATTALVSKAMRDGN